MSTPPDRKADSSASHAVPPPSDPSHPTAAPGEGGTQWQPRPTWAAPTTADGIQVPGYEIQGELGRGGMGVVYLAANVLMKRLEVLKVMNKALLEGNPGMAARFINEIQAAARLDHENVVRALSVPEAGGLLIFAMEYVEGEDLDKLVRREGPLPVAHACHYVSQAAMGLQHAHEKGMVHRDIKPGNLILTRRGKRHVVKILDFGLAKALQGGETAAYKTTTGIAMGTPAFMAPEQAQDAAGADIRSDVYSLGCTLYFLLTGAPPFTGKSQFAILQAHASTEAPSLSQLRAGAPAELAAVAAKMLAKEPARRYQQPIEVAKALAPIIKAAAQLPTEKPRPPAAKAPLVSPSIYDKPTVPPARGTRRRVRRRRLPCRRRFTTNRLYRRRRRRVRRKRRRLFLLRDRGRPAGRPTKRPAGCSAASSRWWCSSWSAWARQVCSSLPARRPPRRRQGNRRHGRAAPALRNRRAILRPRRAPCHWIARRAA